MGKMSKIRLIGDGIIALGIILWLITFFLGDENAATPFVSITGLVVVIGGFVFYFIFWRCPYCRKPLPFRGSLFMEHCPYCGYELDSEE